MHHQCSTDCIARVYGRGSCERTNRVATVHCFGGGLKSFLFLFLFRKLVTVKVSSPLTAAILNSHSSAAQPRYFDSADSWLALRTYFFTYLRWYSNSRDDEVTSMFVRLFVFLHEDIMWPTNYTLAGNLVPVRALVWISNVDYITGRYGKKKTVPACASRKKTALLQQPALPRDQSLRVAHVSGRTHLKIDSDSFGRGPYFSQIPTWQDTRSLNSAARSPHIIYRMRFLHEDIRMKRLRTRDRSITQL